MNATQKTTADDYPLSIERTKGKIVDAMYDLGAGNKFRPIPFHLNPMKKRCENLAVTDSTAFALQHGYHTGAIGHYSTRQRSSSLKA